MLYPLTFSSHLKDVFGAGANWSSFIIRRCRPTPLLANMGDHDRPEGVSVIPMGRWREDLRCSWNITPRIVEGSLRWQGAFHVIKVLDAREMLSLQVHPPASKSAQLGGEPKTEMWYIADAAPDPNCLRAEGRPTRAEFERRIKDARWPIAFIVFPSSRAMPFFCPVARPRHRCRLVISKSSKLDTTYRVFD